MSPFLLHYGQQSLRVVPPTSPERPVTFAYVRDRDTPGPELLRRAIFSCASLGNGSAISQALMASDARPFLSAGGACIQELHLLGCSRPSVRRWSRRHDLEGARLERCNPTSALSEVDRAAFGGFWHFDIEALRDAARATDTSRLRAVTVDGQAVGYVLVGTNGNQGFVQRLAVHPDHEGQGYASALLRDGLAWLGRRAVHSVSINTQVTNVRARTLYERHGFTLRPERLIVVGFGASCP